MVTLPEMRGSLAWKMAMSFPPNDCTAYRTPCDLSLMSHFWNWGWRQRAGKVRTLYIKGDIGRTGKCPKLLLCAKLSLHSTLIQSSVSPPWVPSPCPGCQHLSPPSHPPVCRVLPPVATHISGRFLTCPLWKGSPRGQGLLCFAHYCWDPSTQQNDWM